MGGHGALTLGLKNPDKYATISAFAPISHPSAVPWGQKAFKGYLGEDKSQWAQYDATELAKSYSGPEREILVDQGGADSFLKVQLDPSHFISAAESNPKIKLTHRTQASLAYHPLIQCIWATWFPEIWSTAMIQKVLLGILRSKTGFKCVSPCAGRL